MSDWIDSARKRLKEKQAAGSYKLAEGDNCIRVLPRLTPQKKLEGQPWEEFLQHNNVGPKKRFLTCGKNIQGEGECWICDVLLPKLRNSGKAPLKARAEAMSAVEKFVVQVLYLDDRNQFNGPVSWYAPSGGRRSLATQLMSRLIPGKRDVVDIKKGYNLNIERTGQGLQTRYGAVIPDDDPVPVPIDLLKKMRPFEEIIPKYDPNAQQAAYKGEDVEEDDQGYETGEEEVETKAKAIEEEDDNPFAEDEETLPAVEEEEEEEPIVAKGKANSGGGITDEELLGIFDNDDAPPPPVIKKGVARKK